MPAVKDNEANLDASLMVDPYTAQEDGKKADDKKSLNFEMPKWLICVSKKNKKYESYIFKKNAENFRTFFNLSIITFSLTILLMNIEFFTITKISFLQALAASLSGVIVLMTAMMIYLSTYFTKKYPTKTMIYLGLYFLTIFFFFEVSFYGGY